MGSSDVVSRNSDKWDWERGKKTVLSSVAAKPGYLWQEESLVSPDGETFSAVVRLEDESFTLRVNNEEWPESYEKAWLPRFCPDGRLTALVMADDEWTLAVDGAPWEERFAFIWGTMFGPEGQIYAAIQQDMRYGICADGTAWDTLYINATDFSLRADGRKTAAVVQVSPLKQADISGFFSGVYSVAVDGEAWDASFMNVWTPVFDGRGGERVAAQVRLNSYEYTIAINGEPWPTAYNCVWAPSFDPATGALAAPVRAGGRWGMAVDAALAWKPRYHQCWQQQWSPDGKHLWAVVAPEYGKFTVARNDSPWRETFPCITDLTLSPDGGRAAALASHLNDGFCVVVDGAAWQGSWDMAWRPVFSPDGGHVAALVRGSGGSMTYLVDNKPVGESFSRAWAPAFSPDGRSLLMRGIQNGSLVRVVMPLADIV